MRKVRYESSPFNPVWCAQLQTHLDSTQRLQRAEQDLHAAVQSKDQQLGEEHKR